MKRTTLLGTFLAAHLSLGGAFGTASADVISLRADEWCPYNCKLDSDKPGYMIEIAREIFKRAGHEVDYQVLNWMRSIAETREGRHTAIVGALRVEAPDFIFPGESLGIISGGFAVRKNVHFRYNGPESFEGLTIGAIRGYDYLGGIDKYITAYGKVRTRVQLTSGEDALEQNLKKLVAGRVDVVLDDRNVLNLAIQELGFDHLIDVAEPNGVVKHANIAFSPAHQRASDYAALHTDGIRDLRASGRLAEILGRYGLVDWH